MVHRSLSNTRVDEIDKIVACNIRTQRLMKGLSQSELAEAVGVSIQQIQKYEKGIDRLSSSRLYNFSKLFNVPISVFFGGEKDIGMNLEEEYEERSERDVLILVRAFSKISDPSIRRKILDLMQQLAAND